MKESDLQKLIEVRSMLIAQYEKLDGHANPGTAVILQRDVASLVERTVKKIDEVLGGHVTIKSKR
jgi:hypothetical protein